MDPLLDVTAVARRLALSPWAVYRLVKSGELPATRLGGPKRPTYRIAAADVERLIESRRVRVVRVAKARRGERVPTYV